MKDGTYTVAIVGAGERARTMLERLLDVPRLKVECIVDGGSPESADGRTAPGLVCAAEHGVRCLTLDRLDEVAADPAVDLILETTGEPATMAALRDSGPRAYVLDATGTHFVEHLLAQAARATECAIAEGACYLRQASHQLKSPLASVQSYANVILGGYTGELPERTRQIVEKIHARCEAALAGLAKRRILADLRCSGHDGLQPEDIHLRDAISRAAESQRPLAEARGIEIRILPYEGADLVRGDARHLAVLLSELLQNAVVYSYEGGLVEVALARDHDDRLTVSVRDHGIGVPARCLARIFDEDYRADPSVRHHPEGAGLGLTIAQEIAALHGFRLEVVSEEGRGSEFTLTVPPASRS